MPIFSITHRWTGEVIKSGEARSLQALARQAIREGADLTAADLTGVNLTGANLTGARLTGARLTGADLTRVNLTGARLTGADLTRVNLTEADLTDVNLTDADLTRVNLTGVPVIPGIDRAILEAIESDGHALDMRSWHICQTTHCRAGWAIHLAGEAGYALERKIGPAAAGALIYAASRPGMRVPDFVASNEDAMADLRVCAAITGTTPECV